MNKSSPTPTPIPVAQQPQKQFPQAPERGEDHDSVSTKTATEERKPVFRLHFNDLSHPASFHFLNLVDGSRILPNALEAIRKHLYPSEPSGKPHDQSQKFHLPPTRSVTVILRSMGGVAYTTGLDIDSSHKEIHVSLDYIQNCTNDPHRRRDEIIGVITHEMVHCYQYDGEQTAPGGLIEGIADFVRLKAGLGPPHWFDENGRKPRGDKWDHGYQKTAFFLEWLEEVYGVGTVGRINDALRTAKYNESRGFWEGLFGQGKKDFWEGLFGEGKTIEALWEAYCEAQDKGKEAQATQTKPIPTCAATDSATDGSGQSSVLKEARSYETDDIVVIDN
ncbi:putative pbsp domain protein [Phaeomoniella chlamydospora]|uniref:Putative pbsp domain protein n=1 Tax=Phaeomoniella chlamydospora TaxID=158046 RepID=A0A0G2EF13_PHACM|nr:putative pbsp domain protein [Phaeomoniella chlamydospora]